MGQRAAGLLVIKWSYDESGKNSIISCNLKMINTFSN
jgi:hypothetical protein